MHRKSNADELQEQWRQTYSLNNVMNFATCNALPSGTVDMK